MVGKFFRFSQFTLYADCKKRNRPSFIKNVAKPILQKPLMSIQSRISKNM
ncbi:D-aminoacyl-tRNA deacylase [Dubosiella newyorkensis]